VYICAFAAVSLGSTLPAADAAEADTAHGTFRSQTIKLDVRSAIAFRGQPVLGGSDQVFIVAVTNARMHGDALADYYDRRRAVEKRIKDDETGVVYFEFRLDGRYRGLSYYFASGNGCGYCTSDVVSTVKLADGRLLGTLKGSEPGRPFDIALDVPVMSDDHGAALPADGGAPGAAYLAYHSALAKRDRATLKASLSLDRQQTWADADKKGDLSRFVDYLAGEHPDKSVRIVRGFMKGNTAVLLVTGESSTIGGLSGEVLLMKEKDAWRVDDELMDLVLR
jgi:hypothetical protein